MAVTIDPGAFLEGKKKVLAGWVLWPVVTTLATMAFVKVLGVGFMDAVKGACLIGGSIPLQLMVQGYVDGVKIKQNGNGGSVPPVTGGGQ